MECTWNSVSASLLVNASSCLLEEGLYYVALEEFTCHFRGHNKDQWPLFTLKQVTKKGPLKESINKLSSKRWQSRSSNQFTRIQEIFDRSNVQVSLFDSFHSNEMRKLVHAMDALAESSFLSTLSLFLFFSPFSLPWSKVSCPVYLLIDVWHLPHKVFYVFCSLQFYVQTQQELHQGSHQALAQVTTILNNANKLDLKTTAVALSVVTWTRQAHWHQSNDEDALWRWK